MLATLLFAGFFATSSVRAEEGNPCITLKYETDAGKLPDLVDGCRKEQKKIVQMVWKVALNPIAILNFIDFSVGRRAETKVGFFRFVYEDAASLLGGDDQKDGGRLRISSRPLQRSGGAACILRKEQRHGPWQDRRGRSERPSSVTL